MAMLQSHTGHLKWFSLLAGAMNRVPTEIEIVGQVVVEIVSLFPSSIVVRDLYARMLLTRLVDECALKLCERDSIGFVASCRGYEAAQVASAVCIEVGNDFTLPYYRDLGVVLTIGMTPYEVFRTYLQASHQRRQPDTGEHSGSTLAGEQRTLHWGYHKHNMVTEPAPVATQILHAAGIAFASKLRKVPVVTVAYCGDGAASEADFLEGIRFAALHQLPAIVIYEQECSDTSENPTSSALSEIPLPLGLEYCCIDGSDCIAIYSAMQAAIGHARNGHGPVLLEVRVHCSLPSEFSKDEERQEDPLLQCQRYLEEHGMWDEQWAIQLRARLASEVEQAMQDASR